MVDSLEKLLILVKLKLLLVIIAFIAAGTFKCYLLVVVLFYELGILSNDY